MRPLDRRLLRFARGTAAAIGVSIVLGVATAGLAVCQAALLATAIAGAFAGAAATPITGAGSAAALPLAREPRAATLAALACVLVARAAVAWAREAAAFRCSAAVKSSLRRLVLEHAARLGPRWSSAARSGEVVTLATRGLDSLDAYFALYLPQLALAAIVPVAVVAAMVPADLIAALTVALTVPLIPVFMSLTGRATEARRRARWLALARLSHVFLDSVSGLTTLRVFGRSGAQRRGLRAASDAYRRETMRTLRVAFLSAFALELGSTLSVALVAVGVGLRLVSGDLDLRTGLFVLILAPEAYLPLRMLGTHYHASQEGLSAAAQAFAIIETQPDPGGSRRDMPDLRHGELRVERLSVRQPDRDLEAPSEASLTVRPGEVVGVAGTSGAGKTTLLLAILGLVPPNGGRVVVAGPTGAADLASLDGDAWRRHVAWVPQRPYLFAATVADNVRLARPDASPAEIGAALDAVGLARLDPATRLGEGGRGLSSGERRRLGVARALLREADLLLLDEPTAGLDPDAEAAVLTAVRRAAVRGAAVVIVAHRPDALAAADRVVSVSARNVESGAAGGGVAAGMLAAGAGTA